MGCSKIEERIEKLLLFSGNQVWFTKNGKVLGGTLGGKSITEDGDYYESAYRVITGNGKSINSNIILERDIFPSYTAANISLMSCELEQKIPELLDSSFTNFALMGYKNTIWNRFLDRAIKSIQKLKV